MHKGNDLSRSVNLSVGASLTVGLLWLAAPVLLALGVVLIAYGLVRIVCEVRRIYREFRPARITPPARRVVLDEAALEHRRRMAAILSR